LNRIYQTSVVAQGKNKRNYYSYGENLIRKGDQNRKVDGRDLREVGHKGLKEQQKKRFSAEHFTRRTCHTTE